MCMTDPLADMMTRIRNGQKVGKSEVKIPASKVKFEIAKVLKSEGYIEDCKLSEVTGKKEIQIQLKYYNGVPVINKIQRISRPGLRVYKNKSDLPVVLGGLGISIISTPSGVMTDKQARIAGHGGEVICVVS